MSYLNIKQFWYVTITTYGRDLEPNVPYLLDVIEDFKTLSLRLGKYAVGWRFTPIIITPNYPKERHLKAFEYIASRDITYSIGCRTGSKLTVLISILCIT